jgi:phosphopantothenoylcysteine decarboxylase / phosphopantothenate---cysteine ligase
MSPCNLLFVVTGSIAAFRACEVLSQLVQRGHRVRVVATPAALRFVGEATLEGLSGQRVSQDLFAAGEAMDHIRLTRWADAVVVCPATASVINRLAAGLGDDLVGALFLAHDRVKPWIMAPAMNPAMWSHPATERAVAQLREWGVRWVPVESGRTACGEVGAGRLASPAVIVASIEGAVAKPARRLRVLITSGGTAERIDGVRLLTNVSTGYTGAHLAAHFQRCGHDVMLVRAASAVAAPPLVRTECFVTYEDLDAVLSRTLGGGDFDAVIHAAAVGDFRAGAVGEGGAKVAREGKLSSGRAWTLDLVPRPKLLDTLRSRGLAPGGRIVAFKLTVEASEAETTTAVGRLFSESAPDFVVHNDLEQRGTAPDAFPATLHARAGGGPVRCATRDDLARALERLLQPETSTLPSHASLP